MREPPSARHGGAMTPARPSLAELPEMNPGPVCRLTVTGEIDLANEAAGRIFGVGDLVGRSWLDLSPSLTSPVWKQIVASPAAHQYGEVVGDLTFVFTVVHRLESRHVYVYGTDVTRLKAAERALAERTAELQELARFPEMNPGPVCRLDRAATVVLANRAARELFEDPGLVGKCWKDLCPGMDAARWEAVLAAPDVTVHETRIRGHELVFTHTPGKEARVVFVYGTDVTAQKAAERALRQADKLATLGTLAAGVAHELNNPAAAAQRAARQMSEAFGVFQQLQLQLGQHDFTDEQYRLLEELAAEARRRAVAGRDLDAVTLSDREAEVEAWLEAQGLPDAWEPAPNLASMGLVPEALDRVAARIGHDAVGLVLHWLSQGYAVYTLLEQVCHGSHRVSEIVTALKAYSFLGQAPIQAVDVNEGLRNTLVVLRSKLKGGVVVRQDLGDLPRIQAYGSELNQVWTNLIDNAVHAMCGKGTIHLRTVRRAERVVVEVEDDGPGIPPEVQPRIFDPFFTTKPPGEGTGLGLHTCYTIVVKKHGGTLDVTSKPGATRFTVTIPLAPVAPGGPADPA